jgi:predicted DNA binding CopG/RHH family protein
MKKKPIPQFRSEDEEREFWSTHDATDYIDFSSAQTAAFPRARPSLRTIWIRLPESLLDSLKIIAHKKDVPYQSLLKIMLSDSVERELNSRERRSVKARPKRLSKG